MRLAFLWYNNVYNYMCTSVNFHCFHVHSSATLATNVGTSRQQWIFILQDTYRVLCSARCLIILNTVVRSKNVVIYGDNYRRIARSDYRLESVAFVENE